MVSRFRIPPPILNVARIDEPLDLHFGDAASMQRAFDESEAGAVYRDVSTRFLPLVRKVISEADDARIGAYTEPKADWLIAVYGTAGALAIAYIGRRVGDFLVKGDGEVEESDAALTIIKEQADFLTRELGQHRAAEIFRTLQRETERAIGRRFGDSSVDRRC